MTQSQECPPLSQQSINRVNLTQQIDRFIKLEKLGEGNYGSVYKVRNNKEQQYIIQAIYINFICIPKSLPLVKE